MLLTAAHNTSYANANAKLYNLKFNAKRKTALMMLHLLSACTTHALKLCIALKYTYRITCVFCMCILCIP